jgi:hypothetical protein
LFKKSFPSPHQRRTFNMADTLKVEKLCDSNYRYWRMEAQGILEEKACGRQ